MSIYYPSIQSFQFEIMPRLVHHADITHGDSINVIASAKSIKLWLN